MTDRVVLIAITAPIIAAGDTFWAPILLFFIFICLAFIVGIGLSTFHDLLRTL